MDITVDRVKDLIRDHLVALDKHVLMFEETQSDNFEQHIAEIKFGMKTLNELLQTIEIIEQLPIPTQK